MKHRAVILVGMGFGDEGKGTITDYWTREYGSTLTVRFCGGAQAAHRVVTPEGQAHVFHQFGSGTLAGANTFYSKFCYFNPIALLWEAKALSDLGVVRPLD